MKRRDFNAWLYGFSATFFVSGCSKLGFSTRSSTMEKKTTSPPKQEREANRRSSRRRTTSITDLKTLSKLLQQAYCPLTDMQVEYLLTLKEGPEFTVKIMDILDETQKEVVKGTSGGRRRRGR